jgi:SEC-C motif-containing protein
MNDSTCPCRVTADQPLPLSACCGPYLEGAPAPSPEALMRARYSAYALGDIDFLLNSLAPEARHDFDRKSVTHWSKTSQWLGLDILNTEAGGTGEDEGFVEFVAHFIADGSRQDHRERSRFRRDPETGGWLFVEAANPKKAPVVKPKTPGRNDPCSCGSGKKYKKCCGAVAA